MLPSTNFSQSYGRGLEIKVPKDFGYHKTGL